MSGIIEGYFYDTDGDYVKVLVNSNNTLELCVELDKCEMSYTFNRDTALKLLKVLKTLE